jgi:epoxyqueuosine reductase
MGNRIYGCDDCQQVCPWNRFASLTDEGDFMPRHDLDTIDLLKIFQWSEETFLKKTEGSAIRRIGHESWIRNIAIALGNAPKNDAILAALTAQANHPNPIIREHVLWAIEQQNN